MSRGPLHSIRPCAVWLGVTAAAAVAAGSVPEAWRDAEGAAPGQTVDVVVAGCATALALALGWLWLVTSVAVAELLAGSAPRAGGATRRLVLLACGVAVAATTALPAHASGGDRAEALVGLPLPERAVAPAVVERGTAPPPTAASATGDSRSTTRAAYVVRAGDSLWSIARAHPAAGVDVADRWREIWRHNRDVVGADPDLIHPGQVLRLPGPDTEPDTEPDTDKDGERR